MSKKKKKKFSLKKIFEGFTLVELLAVIVILAIIMIIAIPSVLETMETSRRKTTLEYYYKVVNAVETQYVQDTSSGKITNIGKYSHYLYSIKDDLGIGNTGNFFGFADMRNSDGKLYTDVFLVNDNYALIFSSENGEPTLDNLVDVNNLNNLLSTMTGGTIPSAKDLTMDSFIKIITDNTKCAGDHEYYYEAKTGRTIGHTVYKAEYHDADGKCEEMSMYDYMESIK